MCWPSRECRRCSWSICGPRSVSSPTEQVASPRRLTAIVWSPGMPICGMLTLQATSRVPPSGVGVRRHGTEGSDDGKDDLGERGGGRRRPHGRGLMSNLTPIQSLSCTQLLSRLQRAEIQEDLNRQDRFAYLVPLQKLCCSHRTSLILFPVRRGLQVPKLVHIL